MTDTQKIARLNDQLRATFLTGKVVLTEGVSSLTSAQQFEIVSQVREFKVFTEDNDPLGEHDFGAFTVDGVGNVFWKIDYYAPGYEAGSEDPSDPLKTARVLTIMLASEY